MYLDYRTVTLPCQPSQQPCEPETPQVLALRWDRNTEEPGTHGLVPETVSYTVMPGPARPPTMVGGLCDSEGAMAEPARESGDLVGGTGGSRRLPQQLPSGRHG